MPINRIPKVKSVSGKIGDVILTSSDVGLGNVNNTSDTNKPISNAVLSALTGKQDVLTPGSGITIVNGVISATGGGGLPGGYSEGDVLTIEAGTQRWKPRSEIVAEALADLSLLPSTQPDSASGVEDTPMSGNVLTNDSTLTGDLYVTKYAVQTLNQGVKTYTAGVSSTTNPLGTFVLRSDGSWDLTPQANQNGVIPPVIYTVSNGLAEATGSLSISVTAVNDAPQPNNDSVIGVEDSTLTIHVLGNDMDAEGSAINVTKIAGQAVSVGSTVTLEHCAVTLNSGGTLSIVPQTGFVGTIEFSYSVSDGELEGTANVYAVFSATDPGVGTTNWVTDTSVIDGFDWAASAIPKNGTVVEPKTGATIRRLTDVTQDLPGSVALYNAYSRYPTENITGEYQLAFAGNSYQCLVIDRSSGAVVSSLSYDSFNIPSHGIGAAHEIRWHYMLDHPYRVYYVKGTQFWMIDDVRNQNATRIMIKDFGTVIDWGSTPNNARQIYMDQEGNSSLDSDHWAWMATYYDPTMGGTGGNRVRAFVHYQISTDTVDLMYPSNLTGFNMVPANETTLQGFSYRPNMVEMAPDASGVLLHFDRAYPDHNAGYVTSCFEAPYLWPIDFKPTTFQPFRLGSDSTHSGWSTVDGNWYYVAHDNRRDKWSAVPIFGANRGYGNEGNLDVNLSLGPRVIDFHTDVAPYAGNHFGLCTNAADGWALVSTYSTQAADTLWFGNAIFLIKIVPEAQTFKWHVAPTCNQYFSGIKADYNEAPASINLAGTRIYTCGDWNGTSDHAPNGERYCDLYSIDLPPNWADHFVPSAPVAGAAPTITGSAQQGQVLTAVDGSFTGFPNPIVSGIWQRVNQSTGVVTDIAGATALTYTLSAGDVGYKVRRKSVGTNGSGAASSYSNEIGPIASIPLPVNTSLPSITGLAQEGATLTASNGAWSNSPTSYALQWKRAGTAISGATGQTYTLTAGDIGGAITVTVVATNAYGDSTPATSAATATVVAAPGVITRIAEAVSTDPSPGSNVLTRTAAPVSVQAGDLIVVSVDWNTNGGTNASVSVSDDSGNTYTAGSVPQLLGGAPYSYCCSQQFWAVASSNNAELDITATNASISTPLDVSVVAYRASSGTSWVHETEAIKATDYVSNPVTSPVFNMPANSVAVGHWFDMYGINGTINTSDTIVHTVRSTSWTMDRIRGNAAANQSITASCDGNAWTRTAVTVQIFSRN